MKPGCPRRGLVDDPDPNPRSGTRGGSVGRGPPRGGGQAIRGRRHRSARGHVRARRRDVPGRGRRRRRSRRLRRRVLLDARAVGLGQDHDPADDRGLRAPERGPDPAPRDRRHDRAAVRPRRQHGLPGLRAVPPHDRRRQRRLRARWSARSARPSAGRASPRPCGWSASRATRRASRASSRVASASGSPWPAPWSTGRASSCSTSRSARSTSSSARRCRSSSRPSSSRSASPSST